MFDAHADTIYEYLARRVGSTVAGDVLSDVFVVAIEHFEDYRPDMGTERSWLFGIANNVLRHHWRAEARRLAALARQHGEPATLGDPLLAVDSRVDAQHDVIRVADAIVALNADDRDLVLMFAWERLTYREISEVMNLPIGTVRSRLHRLRRSLQHQRPQGAEA
jgi:RNA polymerase sigma-70 factor (ECF subfamily)